MYYMFLKGGQPLRRSNQFGMHINLNDHFCGKVWPGFLLSSRDETPRDPEHAQVPKASLVSCPTHDFRVLLKALRAVDICGDGQELLTL